MKHLNAACITVYVIFTCFTACTPLNNFQNITYFSDSVATSQKIVNNQPAVIMPGDRLDIFVTAINQEAAQAFNLPGGESGSGRKSYLVSSSGNIEFVQLGTIAVKGLTVEQLSSKFQEQLVNYIKGPVVIVNIINFRVNVLGEVNRPGTLVVEDGKINILEAISQSGDLTLFGKRENILIVRETNGRREFGRVNISSNSVFDSPYFFLKQNDVIYVEMDKTKLISNDVIAARNIRNYTIVLSTVATILLLYNTFR